MECCEAADRYELVRTLHSDHGFVNSLALSPDGTLLALATDSGGVTIWKAGSGALVRTLGADRGAVYAVTFDPHGRLLATGGLDGIARVWDVGTGQPLHSFEGHSGWINAVAFAADGNQLLTAGRDSTVRVWDVSGGRSVRVIDDYSSEVFVVAASADGQWIGSDKGDTFCVRERGNGRELAAGAVGQWGINALAFGPAKNEFTSSGYDGKVWVWNVLESRVVKSIPVQGGPVISLAIRPDGIVVALLCTGDSTVKLLDTRSWKEIARLPGVSYPAGSVSFSGNGRLLAAGGGDSPIRIWREP